MARFPFLRAIFPAALCLAMLAGCEVRTFPFVSMSDGGESRDASNFDFGFSSSGGNSGNGRTDALGPLPDGGVRLPDGGVCSPVQEICDGVDNDCDGVADNGFNLSTDPGNCGKCGRICTVTHAFPKCTAGECGVSDCLPGWFDVDGLATNGCECLRSNGGVELCDGADNDCNGMTDETFAFQTDTKNCGKCGVICDYAHAAAGCDTGACKIGTCDAGWINLNGDASDGCEYQCTATADPREICDGVDNDCDGGIDNNPIDEGAACGPNVVNTGVCKRGIMTCTSGSLVCIGAVQPGIEFCDGNDNNCDGNTDEGFDKLNDIRYCNNCKPCAIPNAVPMCTVGSCQIEVCSPGFVNLDTQLANGCEYQCTFTGIDVCNGRDDDCDGMTDEGIDKTTDVNNCGQCGNVCRFPNAQPMCNGQCVQGPCNTNFYDLNPAVPGCEYFCVKTGNTELCDGVDNNCNGQTDEGFVLASDADNCGQCGIKCQYTHAAAACSNSTCQMGACQPGFVDVDGNPGNGCEYQCTPTNNGVEICDGLDNNCNKQVDESDPQLDANCFPNGQTGCNVGTGMCSGICGFGKNKCLGGQLSCQGYQLPQPETCDNIDNNCNGATDEDFDKQSDPRFCGSCSKSCSFPHAIALCQTGQCAMGPCQAGWVDLNGDMMGCEYNCTKTGPELCDGVDNDCDGLTDAADSDLLYPSTNFCIQFGECGKGPGGSSRYAENTFPVCTIPSGGTAPDWVCNYPATVELVGTNEIAPQESLCDGKDNDCDTATDEFVPTLGNTCSDTGIGECKRIGAIACVAGSPKAAPVCDYGGVVAKTAQNEICDNKDNDCDGITDEVWDNPNGLTLCGGVNCLGVRDGVALVSGTAPTLYIYQYEASRPDASDTSQGTLTTRSCSTLDKKPWTSLTYQQAQSACSAAGMRLCRTNRTDCNAVPALNAAADEWGVACGRTLACGASPTFPYGCAYGAATCNGADRVPLASADTTPTGTPLTSCVTADLDTGTGGVQGAFDMSGNVSEWTEDCRGKLSDGRSIYTLRGGDYLSGFFSGVPSALQCDFYQVEVAANYSHPSTGFRCCSDCAPGLAECSGTCVNLAGNVNNCGACGTVCGGGLSCVNGRCQ